MVFRSPIHTRSMSRREGSLGNTNGEQTFICNSPTRSSRGRNTSGGIAERNSDISRHRCDEDSDMTQRSRDYLLLEIQRTEEEIAQNELKLLEEQLASLKIKKQRLLSKQFNRLNNVQCLEERPQPSLQGHHQQQPSASERATVATHHGHQSPCQSSRQPPSSAVAAQQGHQRPYQSACLSACQPACPSACQPARSSACQPARSSACQPPPSPPIAVHREHQSSRLSACQPLLSSPTAEQRPFQSSVNWSARREESPVRSQRERELLHQETPNVSRCVTNYTEQCLERHTQALVDAFEKCHFKREEKLDYRSVCRDLPVFSGSISEWMPFKKSYENSKKLGKFSPEENIARLSKALKGKARESVALLLGIADNPDEIVTSLEEEFAHPALVVRELEKKIASLSRLPLDYKGELGSFTSTVHNTVAVLEKLKEYHHHLRCDINQLILSKLPITLISRWEDWASVKDDGVESKNSLIVRFLREEMTKARLYGAPPRESKDIVQVKWKKPCTVNNTSVSTRKYTGNNFKKCRLCKRSHSLDKCQDFAKMDTSKRWKWSSSNGKCYRCLQSGHRIGQCNTDIVCGINGCSEKHHPLLHVDKDSSEHSNTEGEVIINNVITAKQVYLKVAPVIISGPKGQVRTYALFDQGSEATLVTEELAKKVGASGTEQSINLNLLHVGATVRSQIVTLKIRGSNMSQTFEINARTLPTLGQRTQRKMIDTSRFKHLQDLQSVSFTGKPEILIGNDNGTLIETLELRINRPNEPMASRTALGWVFHGARAQGTARGDIHIMNISLEDMITQSYDLDALGVSSSQRVHHSHQQAMDILRNTTRHLDNGFWETGLLWKKEEVTFPQTRLMAENRLKTLSKKFHKDENYTDRYRIEMKKLFDKEYAEACDTPSTKKTWYLPHFGVVNPNKPNKLRVVFDAAAGVKGKTLNDFLLKGPDLLNSLFAILLRFREGRFAITADIREMFLRIKIRKEDRDALRFLWWKDSIIGGEIKEYRMTSLTFGATSSPTTANYVKNRNAQEYELEMPDAAAVTQNSFYIDDCVHSMDSEQEAVKLTSNLIELHNRGGFQLTTWTSNSQLVMAIIPEEDKSVLKQVGLGDTPWEKTLGMIWEPSSDALRFNMSFNRVRKEIIQGVTKPTFREVLSLVMSIFDPLGLATPVTIRGRILIQDIWRESSLNKKDRWDTEISTTSYNKFMEWLDDVKLLKEVLIPRHYGDIKEDVELHTFVDASEQAYGAACYFMFTMENRRNAVLLSSKARVAPLRPTSIPRLELQAAVLGARLATTVVKELRIKPKKRFFWSDSRTALAWIKTDPRDFKAYVSHRLGEIDELTSKEEWKWVPTQDNVADIVTRNIGELDMMPTGKWFKGPRFIIEDEIKWPRQPEGSTLITGVEELKVQINCVTTSQIKEIITPEENRFSSWKRLLYSMAYVLYFIDKMRKRITDNGLNIRYLEKAEFLLLKKAQYESFCKELQEIEAGKPIHAKSRLRQCETYMDSQGLLRLKGRASANSEINRTDAVVLDGKHRITRLLVQEYHERANHHGSEMVVNELRQKYWILRLRPTVRTIASQCQKCRIVRAKTGLIPIGDLPRIRLQHHYRPFTNTGVDYFGPMEVKVGRRREKRWGALFTCMTVRAVHIELASSLTTDSAIMALRRFMARRGAPAVIISDNGTNFHGASNELKRATQELDKDKIRNYALSKGSEWKFIPPASPHMGGSWERLVRSVKNSLNATLRTRAPTEEVLATLLTEAEYSVNSRPLTHVSVNPEDMEALTPNHFLLGSSSGMPTPGVFDETDLVRRKHWRISQQLADNFWTRWIREYLPELQPKPTVDLKEYRKLEEGDIVIIADPSSPRNSWPRGRIHRVFPGKDGRVRVVEVTTTTGLFKRAARNIIRLPVAKTDLESQT